MSESDQIHDLRARLQSRIRRMREAAIAEAANLDFQSLEEPENFAFMLDALRSPILRDCAADSLSRLIRVIDADQLSVIDAAAREMLRESLLIIRPERRPGYLESAVRLLARAKDVDSIPQLRDLVEKATIRTVWATPISYRSKPTTMRTFEGTPEEERAMHRVRNSAHAALDLLQRHADSLSETSTLLRPATPTGPESLLRPAEPGSSPGRDLLTPAQVPEMKAPRTES